MIVALHLCVVGVGTATADELRIPWRSGEHRTAPADSRRVADVLAAIAAAPGAQHVVVQFRESPDRKDRAKLAASGVTLLSYLSENAFFASLSSNGVAADALGDVRSLAYAASVDVRWKLHPLLAAGEEPTWAIVDGGVRGDPVIGAYVLFYSDVSLASSAVNAVVTHGGTVRAEMRSINGMVIEIRQSHIAALAREDIVQYVEPAMPKLGELNNGNRVLVGADIVQAPPYNLDGSGVTVMVYDSGRAVRGDGFIHPDLNGHLAFGDSSPASAHASHVAGTLAGNGAQSGGTFRGMAPVADILSYGFQSDGADVFLYSNPGDIEADCLDAIGTGGADIVNNSIGTNVCENSGPPLFVPCPITGDYGVTSALIDAIVAGSLGAPFRSIWATGNERGCNNCPNEHDADGYHSTAPPACGKNHITVGAVHSDLDAVAEFTSWGPCDDGRRKPDVCAPGSQTSIDMGVTSCNTEFGVFGYAVRSGTSMAAPTVTGLAALLLQDYRAQFPARPDFRNSTLKTMLAHNAKDVDDDGPDFRCGFGSVRIKKTVDSMRLGSFLEYQVDHLETFSALVVVKPGDPLLKATLAWDDAPGTPNVGPSLVNDLDLTAIDESGTTYFPWTLNAGNPSAPAVQTDADHRNNIEQVLINAPPPGVYRVEVHGFNVPFGPQPFSLMTTPAMVLCSPAGTISLDRSEYSSGHSAVIQVVDCDLNTDAAVVEDLAVTITSDSEPAGETVILTEVGADRAVFRGAIDLDIVDAPGVLQITVGDTLSTSYTDLDNGVGGQNVVVSATAGVVPNSFTVALQIGGIDTPVTRNVTFVLTDCSGPTSTTVTVPMDFDATGVANTVLTTANPNVSWLSAVEGHTLRRVIPLGPPLLGAVDLMGVNRLLTGDFTGDNLIDVEDLSMLASNWNTVGSAADVNGDNVQSTIDFTAISVNFFAVGDAVDGCGP